MQQSAVLGEVGDIAHREIDITASFIDCERQLCVRSAMVGLVDCPPKCALVAVDFWRKHGLQRLRSASGPRCNGARRVDPRMAPQPPSYVRTAQRRREGIPSNFEVLGYFIYLATIFFEPMGTAV